MKNLSDKILFTKALIIIVYIVGLTGMIIPATRTLFIFLTPLNLIFSTMLLFLFREKSKKNNIHLLSVIYFVSMLIEIIGVKSGVPFGSYFYGNALGPMVYNVPWLVGLNWVLLSYMTATLANQFSVKGFYQVIIASLFMVAFDVVLEQNASTMHMWYWQNNRIPFQNFAMWFALSLAFQGFIRFYKINIKNPISILLFITQFVFFMILIVFQHVAK